MTLERPGVESATSRSPVRRHNHYTTIYHWKLEQQRKIIANIMETPIVVLSYLQRLSADVKVERRVRITIIYKRQRQQRYRVCLLQSQSKLRESFL